MSTALDPVTYTLAAPIMTHAGELKTLTLKPAKARSFIKGVPYVVQESVNDAGDVCFQTIWNTKVCFAFLADMSGVDEMDLLDIPGQDVLPLFKIIFDFSYGRPPKSKA